MFANESTENDDIEALVDSKKTSMVAKVSSRTSTERGQEISLALDVLHCHLFDKETEDSILDGIGTKTYIPEKENELGIAASIRAANEKKGKKK